MGQLAYKNPSKYEHKADQDQSPKQQHFIQLTTEVMSQEVQNEI